MINKRGFTLMEMMASLIVIGIGMMLLGHANNLLMRNKVAVDKMYETTSTYDYLIHSLVKDIKSSDGTFQVETNTFRAYRYDGTYNEIRFDLGVIYRNGEKICDADNVVFTQIGGAIQVDMTFEDMPDVHLSLYGPQPGFDG